MNRISALLDSLSTNEQWLFRLAATAVILGAVGIGAIGLSYITETIPEYGGTYTEGFIGYPTAPNPITATSSTDQTLIKLVYSGLLRKVSWNNYQNDLGTCTTLPNNTDIRCAITEGAYFHDGEPVTVDDLIFTYETIQKAGDRSPLYQSFVGVTFSKEDERTIVFHLPKSFSGFQEALTAGILPKHIWKNIPVADISSQSTLEKMLVGSGPYRLVNHTSSKDHIKSTKLRANTRSTIRTPHITNLNLKYYSETSEIIQAFNKKTIDGFVLDSEKITLVDQVKQPYKRIPIVHPDIYGVFTRTSLQNERTTISKLEPLVRSVNMADFGFPWDKPLPPWGISELLDSSQSYDILNSIAVTANTPASSPDTSRVLVTVNQESLISLAGALSKTLASINFPVEMRVFDFSGFKNSVVPKRSFNYLVFGERYRHISDAYAYWNSSERADPGLNITETVDSTIDNYTNILTKHPNEQQNHKETFDKLNTKITSQQVFLPLYLSRDIYIFNTQSLPTKAPLIYNPTTDRMNSITNWYLNTSLQFKKDLWPI